MNAPLRKKQKERESRDESPMPPTLKWITFLHVLPHRSINSDPFPTNREIHVNEQVFSFFSRVFVVWLLFIISTSETLICTAKNVNICFLMVQVFCPEAIWEIGHESSLYFSCDPFVLLKYTSFYVNVSASLSPSLPLLCYLIM